MIAKTDVLISEVKQDEINPVAILLAESMSTNPNHLAIFKSTQSSVIKKQQRMLEMVLRNKDNNTFIARVNGRIVGAMTYTDSEHCQMPLMRMLTSMPVFIRMFGAHLVPVLVWRRNWAKHDHSIRHIHFGPLAVDRNYQGQGIGKALLHYFCNYLDTTNQAGYLETDRPENVGLYKKFGFQIVKMDTLFGNTNWFMLRK